MFQPDPILISPYIGYQSSTNLYLRGRVLEDEGIEDSSEDRLLRILLNNFRRFETDEVAGARLVLTYQGKDYEVTTDKEGFFELALALPYDPGETPLMMDEYQVTLLDAPGYSKQAVTAIAPVMTLIPDSTFGIISDIDDTVLQTHMTSFLKLKMLHKTFAANAHGRLAMEGIVDFYQQLAFGPDGERQNPFFYLSDSPWNLYDTIISFMKNEALPRGPLFLRDFGLNLGKKRKQFKEHKRLNIQQIFKDFPDLSFVLLGDTASRDTDYYLEAMEKYPDRVKAIYIRQTKLNKNARRVRQLILDSKNPKVIVIEKTAEMIADARKRGLIV